MRRADVEEAGAVWKFDHVVDMRSDADVFVEVLRGVFDGDAGAGFGGLGREGCEGQEQGEVEDCAQGHGGRMLARFDGIGCAEAHGGVGFFRAF